MNVSLISATELSFSDRKLINFRLSSLSKPKNCEPAKRKIWRKTDWSAFNNAVELPLCLNQHIHCPNDLASFLLDTFSAAVLEVSNETRSLKQKICQFFDEELDFLK